MQQANLDSRILDLLILDSPFVMISLRNPINPYHFGIQTEAVKSKKPGFGSEND